MRWLAMIQLVACASGIACGKSSTSASAPFSAEPNVACSGLRLDVEVRTPNLGPNDVIDVAGRSYPLEGRVHDCAADGRVLGVVTGAQVLTIDIDRDVVTVLDRRGGDRVAMSPGAIRWSRGTEVTTRRR